MSTTVSGRLDPEAPVPSLPPDSAATIRADVWRIAWPSVLTAVLMTTNGILDAAFVGHLNRDALAAAGVAGQLLFLLISLGMSITVGTTALVARFTGAQEHEQAEHATGQSLTLGLILGGACWLAVQLVLGWYLRAIGLSPGAAAQCRTFLHMALLGLVPMMIGMVISSAYRGLGDTRTPLKVMVCANIIHATGDWALIYGHLGLPRMEIAGAGIALASANTVSALAFVWFLAHGPLRGALAARHLVPEMDWVRRIMRIGVPAAFTAALRTTSQMSFTAVLAATVEKMSAVAALQIGLRMESIAFMPGFGFSVAASALVGQSLGAREPRRAERYGWCAAWQACGIMTVMATVFYIAAAPFTAVFTSHAGVTPLSILYLRINAFSEPMLAFGMVLTGALQGAGDTMRPAVITIITFWLFRLPVAYFLALRLGWNTAGAWTSMSATTIIAGILTILLYRKGWWKRQDV